MGIHGKIAAACLALSAPAVLGFLSMPSPAFAEARWALYIAAVSLVVLYTSWAFLRQNQVGVQLFYGLPLAFILVFGLVYGRKWIDDRQKNYPLTPLYVGVLRPNHLIDNGHINETKIQIGKSHVFLVNASVLNDVLKAWSQDQFTVETKNGRVSVSTKIRDDDGNIIAELLDNEWKVRPPPGTWDRNYTNDQLEVIDTRGDVALQLRVLDKTIQIQGIWLITLQNERFHLTMQESPASEAPLGAQFILCPVGQRCGTINRAFRYPSDLHLGELQS